VSGYDGHRRTAGPGSLIHIRDNCHTLKQFAGVVVQTRHVAAHRAESSQKLENETGECCKCLGMVAACVRLPSILDRPPQPETDLYSVGKDLADIVMPGLAEKHRYHQVPDSGDSFVDAAGSRFRFPRISVMCG